MTPQPPRYWFRAKRYGWGWGLPSSWQGWVVMLVYLALSGAGMLVLGLSQKIALFVVYQLGLAAVLLAICFKKGEPPGSRWEDRP